MAYRDPYAEQYGQYDQHYTDTPSFNPYNNTQPHQAYDQDGYDPYAAAEHREQANYDQPTIPGGSAFVPGHYKSESATHYDQGAFAQGTAVNRPQDLRHWRYEHHSGLWTKGSRGACIGRFCCCTLMITVFLIVSVLLPLALWARPPDVLVGNVQARSNGSEIQTLSNGVQINLELPIYVSNPNYFSVSFSSIKANIYYPTDHTLIGTGQENDITFHSHSATNFTFPFSIAYTTTMSATIISDLLKKCGIEGGTASDLTVDYDITLALRVAFLTISPTISNSATFKCPLTASEIGSLTSALTGGG